LLFKSKLLAKVTPWIALVSEVPVGI
jgi:hypothetical protein